MTDLLIGGTAWWAIPAVALAFGAVFGFFPGFVLRLLVLLYPADDPRRKELVAELYLLGRMERVEWVFQQLETALFEGIAARLERRRAEPEEPRQEDESLEAKRRWELIAHAKVAAGARPIGRTPVWLKVADVRQVEIATRTLRSLNYQYGSEFCHDALVAQLSWAQQMLNSLATDAVMRRLHVALADLHNLVGWSSFDVGLINSALNHFRHALTLANKGEAHRLVATVLYRLGRVHLHENRLRHALKMFQRSQFAAEQASSEWDVAIAYANQAWVHGLLGEQEQVIRCVRRAREEAVQANLQFVDEAGSGCRRADARYEAFLRTVFPSAAVGQWDAQ